MRFFSSSGAIALSAMAAANSGDSVIARRSQRPTSIRTAPRMNGMRHPQLRKSSSGRSMKAPNTRLARMRPA
jgi:hypothetical protein